VPLASAANATLLLTDPQTLPADVLAELQRALGSPSGEVVYLAGGTDALADTIDQQLRDAGYASLKRFAGAERNATAALVADEVVARNPRPTTSAVLSENRAFADTLGAGSAAGLKDSSGNVIPILLTERANPVLDASTADFLSRTTSLTELVTLGGQQAVDQAVLDTVQTRFPNLTERPRFAGADRFFTNALLNAEVFGRATGQPAKPSPR
jgi:hypothetical protein